MSRSSVNCSARGPMLGAFSLVELLVVIAIIGLLAAMLLPALGSGRAKAHRTQCLTQLQQWGVAQQMYAHDNDDIIPRRGQGVRPLTRLDRPEDWFNVLPPLMNISGFANYAEESFTNPAISPPALFVCPDARPAPARYFLTYGMNLYLSPSSQPEPHRLKDVTTPSAVVFLSDGGVGYSSCFPAVAEYSPQSRHRKFANVVFLDGHAQSFRGEEIGCDTGVIQRSDVIWRFDTNSPPFSP